MARTVSTKPKAERKPRKQTSNAMSRLAARILGGGKYTHAAVCALAGSVLSQDETKGRR